MKNAPELDPELRGLLTEIAADPRSRLRLAPRHALRSWYLTGETIPARPHDATAAERHLLAAHREALAALYCEASALAYWQSPEECARRPEFVLSGSVQTRVQGAFEMRSSRMPPDPEWSSLLAGHASPADGRRLAAASLALVPSSAARLCLAFHAKSEPKAAQELFAHVGQHSPDEKVRARAWSAAGAGAIESQDLTRALECYWKAAEVTPCALPWAVNSSLCVGDQRQASRFLSQMEQWDPGDVLLDETVRVLRSWLCVASPLTSRVKQMGRQLRSGGSAATERILNEYA